MWDRIENRLALVELLTTGELKRRKSQEDAWRWLADTPWRRATGRRDVVALADGAPLKHVLDRFWPDWEDVAHRMGEQGCPPTPTGWRTYEDLQRAGHLGDLPERLNQRTATALVAAHSKAQLTASRRAALGSTEVTRDGLVRLRPPPGLRVRGGGAEEDADRILAATGELVLSDRALREGAELVGPIEAVLTVENLGAWRDLVPPEGWLVVHVAGWDTATARLLLERLVRVPVVHFGDLDPAGLRIVRHLQRIRSDVRWFVPAFWEEYVARAGLRAAWPDDLELEDAPALVQRLARDGLWLEQEAIVLDGRLTGAFREAVSVLRPP